jgi:hypothetical protein
VLLFSLLLSSGAGSLSTARPGEGPGRGVTRIAVGRMPIGALPAGTYELRIRVSGDGVEVARSAFFTLHE